MALLDFILNLAGLLLWLNWRFLSNSSRTPHASGVSLAGTLKSTQSSRVPAWPYLAGLAGLLVVRAIVYCTIGLNLHTTMVLDLGLVPISFNPRWILRMFLFSGLSFLTFSAVFYVELILISVLNRNVTEPDVCVRWIRLHLGWFEHRAAALRCLIPFLLGFLFWLTAGMVFEYLGMHPPEITRSTRFLRACLMGCSIYIAWVPVLLGLMIYYLVSSYVYFGEAPVATFLNRSAKEFLRLTSFVRLEAFRVDFAPVFWVFVLLWIGWSGCYGRFCGGAGLLSQLWTALK